MKDVASLEQQSADVKKVVASSRLPGLLRLFSSELFSHWMALHYLFKQDQVGIHYYICNRLRSLPLEEVEFIIPQLCHVMITRVDASTPLECLLVNFCRKYVHMSSQILWLLEAYLQEQIQIKTLHEAKLLNRIVRLLKEFQEASFSKDSLASSEPRRTRASNRRRRSYNDAVESPSKHGIDDLPCVKGTIFGFAISLLSFAMPEACRSLHPLALMEARTPQYAEISAVMFPKDRKPVLPGALKEKSFSSPSRSILPTPFNTSSPSLEELHKGNAFDSVPYLSERSNMQVSTGWPLQPSTKNRAPIPSAVKLLYHAEMQLVTSLTEIAKRLRIVPSKESRQKALFVELNLVNHNLPAAICLPFLCNYEHSNFHHRIVRIPPHEATILNSAERVPFLIFLEVINGLTLDGLESLTNLSHGENEELESDDSGSVSQSGDIVEDKQDLIEARTPIFPPNQQEDHVSGEMRVHAIMLAQLNLLANESGTNLEDVNRIRNKLLQDIERLEKDGMIEALSKNNPKLLLGDETKIGSTDAAKRPAIIRDDPSATVFNEKWEEKRARIMQTSPYGQIPGWELLSVVVKSGVDIRQENLACQLIKLIQEIWKEEEVECWSSPHHNVLVVSTEGGLIETIPDTISIHSIKKASFSKGNKNICTLKEFFIERFGNPGQNTFKDALIKFIQSLAGYSLITYVLQLKDRHNGNILIDNEGHIVHIDFGFMLSNAPGGSYVGGIETAPFKLTADYIELLGNMNIHCAEFIMFRGLFMTGFMAIRKHYERLITLLECSIPCSTLPCLSGKETVLAQLKARLLLASTDKYVEQCVDKLITSSAYNMFTRLYDSYQYYSNGIL